MRVPTATFGTSRQIPMHPSFNFASVFGTIAVRQLRANAAIGASRVGSKQWALHCDGHHKMSDLGVAGEPVHRATRCLAATDGHTSDGRWLGWRMIMSNEISELTKTELDAVSGGVAAEGGSSWGHAYWGGGTPPSYPANAAAMKAWNDLLHQYGF